MQPDSNQNQIQQQYKTSNIKQTKLIHIKNFNHQNVQSQIQMRQPISIKKEIPQFGPSFEINKFSIVKEGSLFGKFLQTIIMYNLKNDFVLSAKRQMRFNKQYIISNNKFTQEDKYCIGRIKSYYDKNIKSVIIYDNGKSPKKSQSYQELRKVIMIIKIKTQSEILILKNSKRCGNKQQLSKILADTQNCDIYTLQKQNPKQNKQQKFKIVDKKNRCTLYAFERKKSSIYLGQYETLFFTESIAFFIAIFIICYL